MFTMRYVLVMGFLTMTLINGDDGGDSSSTELDSADPPDFKVDLSVDTYPKSPHSSLYDDDARSMTETTTQFDHETFACYKCDDCQSKSNFSIEHCQSGVRHCFTLFRKMDDGTRVVRRGCSTAKDQCTVADDQNPYDSVTCCTGVQCNTAIHHSQPFSSLLSIVTFFIFIAASKQF